MTVLYLPVFKLACSYSVTFGRRWSIVEHLILVQLASARMTLDQVATAASLPRRLVVEALINLLRAGWIEMRAAEEAALFRATTSGVKRAGEEDLPVQLHSSIKWTSLCVDRLTGAWIRSDDLQLVYSNDLPAEAMVLDPRQQSYQPRDVPRELLYLRADEALEPTEPSFRTPSRPYARVEIAFGDIEGLPSYAPLDLRAEILNLASTSEDQRRELGQRSRKLEAQGDVVDVLREDDLIVGGEAHRALIEHVLDSARSTAIIHSCFLHPQVIEDLLPAFERAAKRKVRVELLWGLVHDPEDLEKRKSITDSERMLERLPEGARSRVKLSTISSRSHAKVIIFDDRHTGCWSAVVGSCNFLSSWYDALDISVCVRNPELISQVLGRLISTQQPAFGSWPPMTVRLNRVWDQIRRARQRPVNGVEYRLRLVADLEHYACVTDARDAAVEVAPTSVWIGCDLYGLAAETAVLTPMETAAKSGNHVALAYQRPSKFLREEGRKPDHEATAKRGIHLSQVDKLHGKFLIVGSDHVVISSFNWLATALDGTRSRNAEFGIRIAGDGIGEVLKRKLSAAGLDVAAAVGGEIQPKLPLEPEPTP